MRPGILNVIWEDKSVLVQRGEAVVVEYVERRKEYACLDRRNHSIRTSVTQPGREEVRTRVAARQGARIRRHICWEWNRCREGSASIVLLRWPLPCFAGQTTYPWVSRKEGE